MIKRILVAMSGGIDSSAAALLLKKQNYDIVGITMKTWDYADAGSSGKQTGCCDIESFNDARQIAVENNFPHYVLDLREQFTEHVVDDFVGEYMAGRTPNPCIMCNTHIKWKALLHKADQLECSHIATGHYAFIEKEDGRCFVRQARDKTKDQSYVLWGLPQSVLSRTLFPLSIYTKVQIRAMLKDWGYDSLSKKKESYEICFIPDNDYRAFLQKKVPSSFTMVKKGDYVNQRGEKVGEHEGYPFYTIGQRRGLGKAFGKPIYVTAIDSITNTVVLGEERDLYVQSTMVGSINWQKIQSLPIGGIDARIKIRYRDEGTEGRIEAVAGAKHQVAIFFHKAVKGIAPGQSAVFYDVYGDVLGGGFILKQTEP